MQLFEHVKIFDTTTETAGKPFAVEYAEWVEKTKKHDGNLPDLKVLIQTTDNKIYIFHNNAHWSD